MAGPPTVDPYQLDLRVISATLRAGKANGAWMESWLPGTHEAPGRLAEAMYAYIGGRRGAIFKSRPGDSYDLYQDCVAAHLGRRRTALFGREGSDWVEVSYDALHARSNALAAAWIEAGVEAGQKLALVLPVGVDLAVALLTVFRLGAVASIVPPLGPSFVRGALGRLAPDRVATTGLLRGLLPPEAAPLPVAAGSRATSSLVSFSYGADEVAARLLTPFGLAGAKADGVAEATASTLLNGAVRDAIFTFGLDPGEALAAPGFDPRQHEPSLLLAALVAGATHASPSLSDLAREPGLLADARVAVLGVHRGLRDALIERKERLPAGVRTWFRSLTDVTDPARWDEFWREVPDRKQPGFGVVAGAACGGSVLFSFPSLLAPGLRLWPAPGLTWRLSEMLTDGEVPALNDAGVFTLLKDEEADPAAPQTVLGRWSDGYLYGGSLDLGPDAHLYPLDEVEAVAGRLPGVRHAAAFVTAGRWMNEFRVVLLAFIEPGSPPGAVEGRAIEALIAREMGAGFLPDRVEILPLRPRIRKGVVDRSWCRSQYLTGFLNRKADHALFQRIGRLGYLFAPPPAKGLASPLTPEVRHGSICLRWRDDAVLVWRRSQLADGAADQPGPHEHAGRQHHGHGPLPQHPALWHVHEHGQPGGGGGDGGGARGADADALHARAGGAVGARGAHGAHREHAGGRHELQADVLLRRGDPDPWPRAVRRAELRGHHA
jgi:hypothetical protein